MTASGAAHGDARGPWLRVGPLLLCCLGNITVHFLLVNRVNVSCVDGLELGLKELCMFFIKNSCFLFYFSRKTASKYYLEIQATKMYLKGGK